VSNLPSKAFACDTIENATLDSSCVVMAREGQRGVWFSLSEAERLRKASLIVPELQLQIKKFEESEIEKEAREELDAWYHSWWFLTGLGAAIGTGVTLAIVL